MKLIIPKNKNQNTIRHYQRGYGGFSETPLIERSGMQVPVNSFIIPPISEVNCFEELWKILQNNPEERFCLVWSDEEKEVAREFNRICWHCFFVPGGTVALVYYNEDKKTERFYEQSFWKKREDN